MEKRTAIRILLAILLIAIAAFSGCIEEKPTSTPLAPTPTPTLSVTIEDIDEEIELLVKELEYDYNVAQYVAREVNSWTDKQGNTILQGWKEELRDARERYEEGKISVDKLTEVEVKITKELSQKIKEEIPDFNEDNWHLENVIRDKEANCLGYTQLLFISGRVVGLSVEPIEVRESRESGYYEEDHATCLVNLSDRYRVMVELTSSPIFISKPFILEREYERIGNYFELIDKDNPLVLYMRIRMWSKEGLIAGIIDKRGRSNYQQGEYQKAIADHTKAIALDPKDANAYNNRGVVYDNLKEYQKAISDYTKAIELDPKYAKAYNNRGVVYFGLGEYHKAISDLTKAIESDPKYAKAYYNRGVVYLMKRESQKAQRDFDMAVSLDPGLESVVQEILG